MAWVYDSGENGPNMVWQDDPISAPAPAYSPAPQAAAPVAPPPITQNGYTTNLTPQAAIMQAMLAQQQSAPPPAPPPPSYTGTYAAPGQTSIGQPGGFQYGLTDQGQQIAAQNYTPPQMTSGGNYQFDWNQVGKNPTIAVNNNGESNANNQEANPTWQQFTANDGTPLLGAQGANGLEVQKAIDLGGTGFTGQKLSLMNGLPYDVYGANGTLNSTGTRSGYTNEGVGDALGVGSILAMPFAAAAAGLGAGAAGTGAAGVAGGVGDMTAAGYAGLDAASAATLGGGASVGGGAALGSAAPLGSGLLGDATAAGAGTGTMPSLPLMSTADTLGELPMMPAMAPTASLPGLPGTPPVPPGAPSGSPAPAPATPPTFNPAQDSQLANQQLNLPPNSTVPSVATPSATSGIDSVRQAITSALGQAGLTPQQAASLGLALNSMYGSSSNTPALGSGSGTTGGTPVSGSQQGDEAAAFLQKVMPFIRYNASNPTGSANWSKDASGNYALNTQLNSANQGVYNDATSKLGQFTAGLDPNAKAPTLLDSAGGSYSSDLAKTIYDRTMGLQTNNINEQQRKLDQRLAEQGFTPQNEGYSRAMNLYQDNLNEARQAAARDAQIQASTQGLAEANFTNSSRTQGFKNSQDLQAQLAQILTGTRTNATEGLKTLTSQGSAPAGNPANTVAANANQWTADLANQQRSDSTRNDLIRALMNWGLA